MMNTNQVNQAGQYSYSTAMSMVNNQPIFNQSILSKSEPTQIPQTPLQQPVTTIASVPNVNQNSQLMQRQFTIPIQLSTAGLPNSVGGVTGATQGQGGQPVQMTSFQPAAMQVTGESYSATTTNATNSRGSNPINSTVLQPQQKPQPPQQPPPQQQTTTNRNTNNTNKTTNNRNTNANKSTNNSSNQQNPPAKRQRRERINTKKFRSVAVQTAIDVSLFKQQVIVVPPKNCTCGAAKEGIKSGHLHGNSGTTRKYERKNKGAAVVIPEQTDPFGGDLEGQQMYDNRGRPFAFKCFYCPKRFSLNSRLVAHTRCHTGIRPFSCLVCGYSFTQRSYLNRHAAVHKQERPFTCEICHKTYKHYGSLANHRKLHNNSNNAGNANASDNDVVPTSTANTTGDLSGKDDANHSNHEHSSSLSLDSGGPIGNSGGGGGVTGTGGSGGATTGDVFSQQTNYSSQFGYNQVQIQPAGSTTTNSNNNSFQSMIQTSSAF